MVVVSVEYCFVFEDFYLVGLDDCEIAVEWLASGVKQEFGMDNLVIGGELVGGYLVAVMLLCMRDWYGFIGFLVVNFVYGVFDFILIFS